MSNKILVLGVDGLDPRLTKYYLEKGMLPNFEQYIKKGAAREDLVMLGAMPTITPPLWTTLATGAYPGTHGVTCFWNQHPDKLDTLVYSFDSRQCKAEQLWNVFAESGKKTMVWHWPGSAWPPTSDSSNLHVVDGTQPSCINIAVGIAEWDQWIDAREEYKETVIRENENKGDGAGCVITDLETEEEANDTLSVALNSKEVTQILMSEYEGENAGNNKDAHHYIRTSQTPIISAKGWLNAPEGAKEFSISIAKGFERRPVLILKNEQGVYDKVAVYRSKRDTEPMVVLKDNTVISDVHDMIQYKGEKTLVSRQWKLISLAEDGSSVELYMGNTVVCNNDTLFHPKEILQEIRENVGEIHSVAMTLGSHPRVLKEVYCALWESYSDWQARCLNYLICKEEYEVIFSHLHNVDIMGHNCWEAAVYREHLENDDVAVREVMERVYVDTDRYVGQFLYLLDEGWDIFIVSDHGLLCGYEEIPVALGDPFGINAKIMCELGFTTLKKDENGELLREIDWEKTVAVAPRGNHIYINLKGREEHGIVEPSDQYELERKIIDALYNYREPVTGKRIVAMALRAKEAAIIGMQGHGCGDIIYFLEEGFNRVHGDSMSTYWGHEHTSVSPIFIAAGPDIKEGFSTERVIRQVDFAATVAHIGGVRMPAQCEGAVVHQILK